MNTSISYIFRQGFNYLLSTLLRLWKYSSEHREKNPAFMVPTFVVGGKEQQTVKTKFYLVKFKEEK